MIFVFPHDYFDKYSPEEQYQKEFDLARNAGSDTVLANFDAMLEGRDPFYRTCEYEGELAVWRGWQMPVTIYKRFYDYATTHGLNLINTHEQYAACHELSGSYPSIKAFSFDTVFKSTAEATPAAVRAIFDEFGCDKLFVKDTVKGHRFKPCVVAAADTAAEIAAALDDLVADRADAFSGMFAFRRFMPTLKDETRFVVLDGRIIASGRHFSDTAGVSDTEAAEAVAACSGLSRFFTVDMARDGEGKAVVVETGDAQVSECPEGVEEKLICALAAV